jgi:hypothetical protein
MVHYFHGRNSDDHSSYSEHRYGGDYLLFCKPNGQWFRKSTL